MIKLQKLLLPSEAVSYTHLDMKDALNLAGQAFLLYFGEGWYFYFLIAALIYIFIRKHTRKQAGFLAWTTIVLLILIFNPIVVIVLEDVYKRQEFVCEGIDEKEALEKMIQIIEQGLGEEIK